MMMFKSRLPKTLERINIRKIQGKCVSKFKIFNPLGPVIGSVLYGVGGFGMPYWVVGSVGFLVATTLYFLVPTVNGGASESRPSEKSGRDDRKRYTTGKLKDFCKN